LPRLILKRDNGSHVDCDGEEEHKTVMIDLLEEISIWDITGQVHSLVIPASLRFYNPQRIRAKNM